MNGYGYFREGSMPTRLDELIRSVAPTIGNFSALPTLAYAERLLQSGTPRVSKGARARERLREHYTALAPAEVAAYEYIDSLTAHLREEEGYRVKSAEVIKAQEASLIAFIEAFRSWQRVPATLPALLRRLDELFPYLTEVRIHTKLDAPRTPREEHEHLESLLILSVSGGER